jgi:hypothetical protein
VTFALPASIAAAAAALCLAACGDTVSAPTISPTPPPSAAATASPAPTATGRITGSPTPPPPTGAPSTPTSTPAAPVTTTGPIGQTLTVDPGTVPSGSTVHVGGYDPTKSCASMTILSNAFPGPQEFAGVHAVTAPVDATGHFGATVTIPVSIAPGQYPITVRACGGNFGVQVTLTVTAPH